MSGGVREAVLRQSAMWRERANIAEARLADSERVRRQLAEALRPFAEAHRQRTAEGMKVGPGPALGPRQLAEACDALAASDALDKEAT